MKNKIAIANPLHGLGLRKKYSELMECIDGYFIRQRLNSKFNNINFNFMVDGESILSEAGDKIYNFVKQLEVSEKDFEYLYSKSAIRPTLYSSAYACMTLSLVGRLNNLTVGQISQWITYFDGFQNNSDGLFYDSVVDSELFRTADWWGARHLALHMISAYTDLGGKPRHPFRFLEQYYDQGLIKNWLDGFDWSNKFTHADDIDNKIMNIGCLLQYQRDTWGDVQAGSAVAYIQKYLMDKINPETGIWGHFDVKDPDQRSRMVQFAYHLFSLFFYDKIQIQNPDKVIRIVLATQNKLGGFGVKLNSSACEDIDSIDILIRLSPLVPDLKAEIDATLRKALRWVLCNQTDDGGFVFRLYEPFVFGHTETSSKTGQGAMLPTWFRTLSLAYIMNYLDFPNIFITTKCPGYEF